MEMILVPLCAAASVMLLQFLLESRHPTVPGGGWQRVAVWIGCWALLCLRMHWAVMIAAALVCGFAAAWYLSRAKWTKAAVFSLLFAALRMGAWGICLASARLVPELGGANGLLAEHLLLLAVMVVAAFCGTLWRPATSCMWPLICQWLVGLLVCGICAWYFDKDGVQVLQFFLALWLVSGGICTLQTRAKVDSLLLSIEKQQQTQRQYIQQEEYYQQLLEKQAETRALWHDLNKYLRAAQAEAGPAEALAQLQQMLDSATEMVDVGNTVLNVILNEYLQAAKAAGIELRMRVNITRELTVSAADLYIIIGNTMDNAIAACKALPTDQRHMTLLLRTHHDVLFYQLTNPCPHVPTRQSLDPMHGHGLRNVRRCVERYGGALETRIDQGFFVVSAHMNQPAP